MCVSFSMCPLCTLCAYVCFMCPTVSSVIFHTFLCISVFCKRGSCLCLLSMYVLPSLLYESVRARVRYCVQHKGRVSMLVMCVTGCLCVCVMACIISCHIKPHTVGWISHQMCTASAAPRHMTLSVTHHSAVYSQQLQHTHTNTQPPTHTCTQHQPHADKNHLINHTDTSSHTLVHKQINSSLQNKYNCT